MSTQDGGAQPSESSDDATHQHRPGSLSEVADVAWPIVISMLSYTAMGVVDTLLVGWLGTTEVAAVGLATTIMFLFSAFGLGLLQSVKIAVSQATGAQNHDEALSACWQGLWLALPLGLVLAAAGWWATAIFAIMGGPAQVQEQAAIYFTLRVGVGPLWFILVVLSSAFQGTGDTRTPMVVNLIVNGLNIALDLVLVFGLGPIPAMGVAGAAWATAAAQMVGATVILAIFLARFGVRPRLDLPVMRRVVELGLPMGIQFVLDVGSWAVFGAALARLGAEELAAHQISIKILSVSFLPGHGIGEAASVLVGQYVGARNPKAEQRALFSALKLGVVVMGLLGMVFWAVPEWLLGLFQAEPAVVVIGVRLLTIAALFQVADAVAMIAFGALRGRGDTRFTMALSIGSSWLVQLPVGIGLGVVLEMGAVGVWIGLLAHIIFLAVVAMLRLRQPAHPVI